MDPQINQEKKEIKALKTEINFRDEQINALQPSVAELEKSASDLTIGLNDLEQYGKRQAIILNNVRPEDEAECESIVLEILNNTLPRGETWFLNM